MAGIPTAEQLAWQQMELGLFVHLDMFTFKPGWYWWEKPEAGVPGPETFNPQQLDTEQWVAAAQALGAKYAVLTAKHCSGFCLWPTDLYPYSVKQSPWRGGQGDVVGDFVKSCRRAGIRPGFYCSFPNNWYLKIHELKKIDPARAEEQQRYIKIYEAQCRELWSRYGELCEIWFDGGIILPGEGGPDLLPMLRELQPGAMTFHGPEPTIRWVGNEDGWAPDPCWPTVTDLEPIRLGGHVDGGDPEGACYCPAEVDTTLLQQRGDPLSGWFWRPNAAETMFSLEHLLMVYQRSVGRGCNLLLNSSPGPDGLIPAAHMQRYQAFGDEIRRRLANCVGKTSGGGMALEMKFAEPKMIDQVIVMEDLSRGQRIRRHAVDVVIAHSHGSWRELYAGASVGHKRIQRFDPIAVSAVRLRILECAGDPAIVSLEAYDTRR